MPVFSAGHCKAVINRIEFSYHVYNTFRCSVCWGDGSPPYSRSFNSISPCQPPNGHQYAKVDAEYNVTAFYCSATSSLTMDNCVIFNGTIRTFR